MLSSFRRCLHILRGIVLKPFKTICYTLTVPNILIGEYTMSANAVTKDEFLELSHKNFTNQKNLVNELISYINFSDSDESQILKSSVELSKIIKNGKKTFIEELLASYDLNQEEGLSLLCLTEAMLRVKDSATIKLLLEDKLKDKKWLDRVENSSFFMKFTSIGLAVVSENVNFTGEGAFSKFFSHLTSPIIQKIIKYAIKHISDDFIIGSDINKALKRAKSFSKKGYFLSYDILGESSRCEKQSKFYFDEYVKTIKKMGAVSKKGAPIFMQDNLSIKLSSLHPRMEVVKFDLLKQELYPKVKELVSLCAKNSICIMFDAEESFRADAYIKILDMLLYDAEFKNFNGIGIVLQAYHKRTFYLIDHLLKTAKKLDKKLPIRLVKGAYWDFEIKRSQMLGLKDYPVFTHKKFTDICFIACAKKLAEHIGYFYPQFATHNAQTASAILHITKELPKGSFEFQKLFGMGNAMYDSIIKDYPVRIYAPLGKYENLLAYLMRRFIENGANSSFVNQVFKAQDLNKLNESPIKKSTCIEESDKFTFPIPLHIFKKRLNSKGFELGYLCELDFLKSNLAKFKGKRYDAFSIIGDKKVKNTSDSHKIQLPIDIRIEIGKSFKCTQKHLKDALKTAEEGFKSWSIIHFLERKKILLKLADLYEDNKFELYHLLINEAGKSIEDAISEVREAIDFIRYYTQQATYMFSHEKYQQSYTGEHNLLTYHPKGIFLCISPWNFPLAIFTGQIVAALATGNSVITKPASSTCAIATYAVQLMHKAGIDKNAINLVITSGKAVSDVIVSSDEIAGVCITGSTETAWKISRTLAARDAPIASFIAETGGQNCMIVDSSALLEQVSDDVIHSAFISQGQRCSALRILYIQDEIYNELTELLCGALDQLMIGDTNEFANDLGSVIDKNSMQNLEKHVKNFSKKVKVRHSVEIKTSNGYFFRPTIVEIDNISQLDGEKFGSILHLRRFKTNELDRVIEEINSTKFGLTFGIHSRIKGRYLDIANKITAGNIYINRNMIGAVVESNPFGGEGLSGTGFKAGGPNYLLKFLNERTISENVTAIGGNVDLLCYN